MDDPKPWLAIARVPGLHAGHLGGPEGRAHPVLALLSASRPTLESLGCTEGMIEALRRPDADAIERDAVWLAGAGRSLCCWGTPDYPPLLATVADAPLVLYVEGEVRSLSLPQLAVVGSRNPTALGRDTATQFARHFAGGGLAITSGLALGIDAAAHEGALAGGGRTVAVLGCGLDAVYPRENAPLARRIAAGSGALVSDLPPGTPPLKQHFPRRNRIIAGLSVGTLVVEAALRSGSLITARLAAEQGREVFAIPGSIHNPMSRGCHRLIRQGAKLVESADDVLDELGSLLGRLKHEDAGKAPDAQAFSGRPLDKDYEILLDALGFAPARIDTLVGRTGLKADAVASMLLILELDGQVALQHGGTYCRRLPGTTE
jgi:DNA processing protein